jgi:CheY-like chemotaxis protein
MFQRQTRNHRAAVQENDRNIQIDAYHGRRASLLKKDKPLVNDRMASKPTNYHVLVVHHHPATLHMMAAMFRKLRYQVSTARDSAKALIYFSRWTCDLLFTDLDMPVLDGFHLACGVKKHNPQAKVIIMTCRCQAELVGLMKDDSVDGWLFKPFKTQTFKTTLTSIGLGTRSHNLQGKK